MKQKNKNKIKIFKRKSQAGLEFLLLISLYLIILGIVIVYSVNIMNSYIENQQLGDITRTLANTADQVSGIGPGTSKIIAIQLPKGIMQGYTTIREIIVAKQGNKGIENIHSQGNSRIFGLLEVNKGTKYFVLKTEDNYYVSISPISNPDIWNEIIAYYNFEIKNSTHMFEATGKQGLTEITEETRDINCSSPGYIGLGCHFNGEDYHYIEIKNNELFDFEKNSASWGAWIYMNETSNERNILMQKNDDDVNLWGIKIDNNKINCILQDPEIAEDTIEIEEEISTNEWYHIFCVRDVKEKKFNLYLNGLLKDYKDLTIINTIESTKDIYIGSSDPLGIITPVSGSIDEVMIFKRALNEEEMNKLYRLGRALE